MYVVSLCRNLCSSAIDMYQEKCIGKVVYLFVVC